MVSKDQVLSFSFPGSRLRFGRQLSETISEISSNFPRIMARFRAHFSMYIKGNRRAPAHRSQTHYTPTNGKHASNSTRL